MKHLFFVHSFTTYHCALGVIKHQMLSGNDCVFVGGRDFRCPALPEGATQRDLTYRRKLNLGSYRNLLKSIRLVRTADEEIHDTANGKKFHAYVPHTYFHPIHLVLSHKLCTGYSYIEEGVTSYYGIDEINKAYPPNLQLKRTTVFSSIFLRKRFPKCLTFFHQGYSDAFGFSDDSFPDWPRRVSLGPPDYLRKDVDLKKNVPPILVFDALVERGMIAIDSLEKGLTQFLEVLVSSGITTLRFKLHPGQRDSTSKVAIKAILERFRIAIRFEEIDLTSSLEDLFATEDVTIYVFNSAVGIYAAVAGRRVYTINSLISKYDSTYTQNINQLPHIYQTMIPSVHQDVSLQDAMIKLH